LGFFARFAMAAVSAFVAATATVHADAGDKAGSPAFPVMFGGPFTLIDHEGRARNANDFHGRFLLVTFGFTQCPDICPTSLAAVADALDALGERARQVQPLFISVDPARDTPEIVASYVGHFHPSLVGLTGTEAQVRAAARAYRVHRRKVYLPESTGPDDYTVDHSSIMYLMGPDGAFVTLFPYGTDSAFMAAAIAKHLERAPPQ
jgi:protein SCO1/2